MRASFLFSPARRRQQGRQGFTLVELMITMLVVSAVVAAAYQLFASTSEGMYEAESLAQSTDRARYALEKLSRDVESAGAFGSPFSGQDPLVHSRQLNGGELVAGIYAYKRTEDDRRVGPLQENYNLATSSDELIVVGAYDYPFSFEVVLPNDLQTGPIRAPNSYRGALRFSQLDPFQTQAIDPPVLPGGFADTLTNGDQMGARLLQITDRNGFRQFAAIDNAVSYDPSPEVGGLILPQRTMLGSLLERARDQAGASDPAMSNELPGFEPASAGDVAYEAALLDAYRYRVCVDNNDPTNLRLVRERLDAADLAVNGAPPLPELCESGGIGPGNAIVSQEPVADRIVDFRVWYDCADATNDGLVENVTWHSGWIPPDQDDPGHNCMYLDDNNQAGSGVVGQPNLGRMVHIRLSVRTDRERPDLQNFGFQRETGDVVNSIDGALVTKAELPSELGTPVPNLGDLAPDVLGGLQTVDVDGDPRTAARVITLQVDVMLQNFADRRRIQLVQDPLNTPGSDAQSFFAY